MGSALVETMFVRPPSDSEACHPLVFNLCELWVPQAVMPVGVAKVTRGRLGNPGVRARFLLLRETQSHPLWGQGCQELVAPNPGPSGPGSAREGGHPFSEACKAQGWLGQNRERVSTAPQAWERWGPCTYFKPPARTRPRLPGSNSVEVSPSPGGAIGKPCHYQVHGQRQEEGDTQTGPLSALWSLSCPLMQNLLSPAARSPSPTPGPQM